MAARAIGTSTIAFGLVSLPVKLYSTAESSSKISFNMIWKDRGVRVRQQYIDPADGTVVPKDEIVKGYEFAKDQYVLFTKEELEVVEAPKSDEIEIVSFVPAETVPRIFFNKAYYLGPDKGGAKPYALLARALRETKRCAIGRWAARGKQYIVLIRPVEDLVEGLVMQQLLYAGEVRSLRDIDIPKMDVKPGELKLAQQLIEQQSSDKFDPSQYKDDVRERVEAAVQEKVEGKEITVTEEPEAGAQVIDLMEALRASLGKKGGKAAAPVQPEAERKPARKAAGGEGRARKAAKK
jgi:DNA end-binding protein Ku